MGSVKVYNYMSHSVMGGYNYDLSTGYSLHVCDPGINLCTGH